MRFVRWAGLTAAIALLGCKPTIADTYGALPDVGSTLPDFSYPATDGSTLTPIALMGRPTVVALWSTTCSASHSALASIIAINKQYAPRGARVVILADDQDAAVVAAALEQESVLAAVAAHSLIDTFTHDQSVLPWRKAFALPTFLVLDQAGRITYRQIGIEQDAAQRLARIRNHLDSLLIPPAT